jgi:hypothetical protein
MKEFGVPESSNEKHNNNEQKGQRKTPRFSPIAHADQPSTSVVHEFKREDNRKNQLLKLDDVMNWKKQKSNAYCELDTLLERSRQATLEVSKSETGGKFKIPSAYINKLMKGSLRYFIPEEKKQLIGQQREEKVEAVRE